MMERGVIYCYSINNKFYVGKTYTSEKKRQKQHKYNATHGTQTPFCFAIRKYGWENIIKTYQVLEEVKAENLEELNEKLIIRENYWIKEKNSLLPNGYNVHLSNHKKIAYIPNKKERYEKTSKALKGRNNNIYTSKRIICVENGIIYPSIREAERQLGIVKGSLTHVLNGRIKKCHGYSFRYIDFANDKIDNRTSRKDTSIMCIETNKIYNTISECSTEMFGNRNFRKGINKSCILGTKYRQYHFKYLNYDNPLPSLNEN